MKNINLQPKDFKKFFSTPFKVKCFHGSILTRSSVAKADLFFVSKGNFFNIYIKKSKEKICGKAGLELYGNKKEFQKFISKFEKIVDIGNKRVVPKYSKASREMTKEEFKGVFDFLSGFWFFYGFLEFPYMDFPYKEGNEKNNKLMLKNLDDASRFKFKARKLMNKFFFEYGVIDNLLGYVSKQILKSKDYADYLFIEELLKTFNGWKPDRKIIKERRHCYSAAVIDGKFKVFSYKKSLELNKKFTQYKDMTVIKGIIASPGKIKGRAIISSMSRDYKAIARINKKMKRGDILIAETTSPDTIMLCNKAVAIVAEQSGLLSHAAVVSREKGIPCIVQATNSTRILKDGDLVEVDANKGIVRKL